MTKTKRFEMRFSEKTENQLAELQRILTQKLGSEITKTKAVEIAINYLLDKYTSNPQQFRLI